MDIFEKIFMSNNNLPLTTVDHENGINNERKFSQQIEINSKTQPKNPLEDNTVLQLILSYLYEGREDSLTLVRFLKSVILNLMKKTNFLQKLKTSIVKNYICMD